jgi:hypothetical protein
MQLTCPGCGARYRIDTRDWPVHPPGDAGGLPAAAMPAFRPRQVRCKLCRTVWAATPEEEVLELDDPLPPDDPPPPEPAPPAPPPALPGPPSVSRGPLPGPRAFADAAQAPPADPPLAQEADTQSDWEEEEDQPPRKRRWPLLLLALLLAAALAWAALVLGGRVRPEDYGLPPFDPARIGLQGFALPSVSVPPVTLPNVQLPRAPLPPLGIEAEAVRRALPGGRQLWEIAGTISNPTDRRVAVPPVEIALLDAAGATVARWTVRPQETMVAPSATIRFETSAIDPPASAVRLRMQLKPAELGRL